MRSTVGAGLARDGINSVYLMVRGGCIASKPAPTKALLMALILGAASVNHEGRTEARFYCGMLTA
ncbi:hypothetical protein AO240_13815 [Pseudomonas sp. ICMP 460]|nr:hypothetical protein AO240_13815 [Pseudomonas sp. ICMP 460]